MTIRRRLFVLAAIAALVTTTLVAAQSASASRFREQVSGNFSDTAIDTNNDGAAANLFSGATKGKSSATYEGVVEVALDPFTECDGENTATGDLVEYSIVRRYANGDLLTSRMVEGSGAGALCFDLGTGAATLEIDAEFTGGTGRFASASGGYHASYVVQLLVRDPGGGIAHGTFIGTTTGTID